MKTPLRHVAFVLEGFKVGSPAQQLLDRFLLGFPHLGHFHTFENVRLSAYLSGPDDGGGFARRVREHPLVAAATLPEALAGADAVVFAGPTGGLTPNAELLTASLRSAPVSAKFFVHGLLAGTVADAQALYALADTRNIQLLAGTSITVTPRLPAVDLPLGTRARDGLVVVPFSSTEAVQMGFEALLSIVARRARGERGVKTIQSFSGDAVWRAGEDRRWSWALLAAAISRSDSPLGDPVKDGRTQDIVGLGLLPTLVKNPRAWVLDHRDGFRSAVLALEGAVADVNFAVRTAGGKIISAQLYRPPPPAEHHYSYLASALNDFFREGTPPWAAERTLQCVALHERSR